MCECVVYCNTVFFQETQGGKQKDMTKAQAKLVRGMSDKQLEEQRKQLAQQEAQLADVRLICEINGLGTVTQAVLLDVAWCLLARNVLGYGTFS